ncbi:hypothetical protein SUDANB95_02711 [Actinosynnema sp. ALI-1.44]
MGDTGQRAEERPIIRTCFGKTAGGDVVAHFVLDSRDYPDRQAFTAAYREAYAEARRRGTGYEWQSDVIDRDDPRSPLPTWEEFRRAGDAER